MMPKGSIASSPSATGRSTVSAGRGQTATGLRRGEQRSAAAVVGGASASQDAASTSLF